MGSGSNASGDSSVAIGDGAVAQDGAAVSIGAGNVASGAGAVAIGDPNLATGRGAVAIGADNQATGLGAVAIGADSVANGRSAVALGSNANAGAAGSVAIGENAVATRANQVALGSSASTYTLAGIGSAESNAAQSGAVELVTTDAAGNLGTSSLDLAAIEGLGGRTGALEGQVTALNQGLRGANGGIAAAMAMGGTVMPPGSSFAMSFNLATYRGEQGFSGSAVARVSEAVWVSGGVAGSTVRGSTGGRVGVTFGW
jgi:autotransporter adhesin